MKTHSLYQTPIKHSCASLGNLLINSKVQQLHPVERTHPRWGQVRNLWRIQLTTKISAAPTDAGVSKIYD